MECVAQSCIRKGRRRGIEEERREKRGKKTDCISRTADSPIFFAD